MIYLFWTFYTLLNIYLMQFVLADKEIKREARKKVYEKHVHNSSIS